MSKLIEFYEGTGTDSEGRTLAAIWAFSDAEMESVHDFIQWLFPLREPSRFNPDAPLVDDAEIAAFRDDPTLLANLRRSFEGFLAFLGLRFEGDRVVKGEDFESKRDVFSRPNHNWLRISRVLRSLRLLGLEEESRAFFAYLDQARKTGRSAVGDETFRFWMEAAQGE